jgi:hypothetical protein
MESGGAMPRVHELNELSRGDRGGARMSEEERGGAKRSEEEEDITFCRIACVFWLHFCVFSLYMNAC